MPPEDHSPVVGLPRGLNFYKQAAKWVAFLSALGARVVLSPPTNKEIMENGIRLSVDESCLPVKVYLGHVQHLTREKVDFIFVCRHQDFEAREVLCTKLWGLPDVCRNTFELPQGCNWLELNISPTIDKISEYKAYYKLGRTFTRNPFRIRAAFRRALSAQKRYESLLEAGKSPSRALELALSDAHPVSAPAPVRAADGDGDGRIRIALLGHSYLVQDEHLGQPLFKMLRRLGVQVHIVEDLDKEQCRARGRELSPALYWTYNREIVGAADVYLRGGIDGLIFVEAFPCGPDSLALDYAVRKLRGKAAIMRLVIDELQALSGIQTRLESFIDVIQLRRGGADVRH